MYYTLYNSKYWGVPQNRERYFVVGIRADIYKEFVFPEQAETVGTRLLDVLDAEVEEKYYYSDDKVKSIVEQAIEKGALNYESLCSQTGLHSLNGVNRTLRIGGKGSIDKKHNYEYLIEPKIKVVGALDINGYDIIKRVHNPSGLAPTANTCGGRNTEIKVIVPVPEATKKGYAVAGVGDSINLSHINSKTRRGRVGVAQTLLTGTEQHTIDPSNFRVRKLTPTEYGRLQGFPVDDGWEQVVSNTQAYKQFGNAVTVNVARAIATEIKQQIFDDWSDLLL